MQEYEKYIDKKEAYKYGNGPSSYYSFPVNALCTDKNNYKRDIIKAKACYCEEFTPKIQTMIEDFFKNNPRCWYCVVKDIRYFYKNIVMRKLMAFQDDIGKHNKFSFRITKIEEVSKSSCTLNVRENYYLVNKRLINKIQKELFAELSTRNLKAKIIKEIKAKDCYGDTYYSLKVLVSKK